MNTQQLHNYDGHDDHEVFLVPWMNYDGTAITSYTVDCVTCGCEIASIEAVDA